MPRSRSRLATIRLPTEEHDIDRLQTLKNLLYQIRGGITKIKSRKYHNRLRSFQIQIDQATNLITTVKTQMIDSISQAGVREKIQQLVTSIADVPFVANNQGDSMQNAVWVLVN